MVIINGLWSTFCVGGREIAAVTGEDFVSSGRFSEGVTGLRSSSGLQGRCLWSSLPRLARAPRAGPGEWGRTSQLSPCGARCCRARPRPRSAHLARLLPLWAPVWWQQRLPACDRPRQALRTALQTRVGAGGCQFEVVLWKITCLLFVCCGSTKMSGEGTHHPTCSLLNVLNLDFIFSNIVFTPISVPSPSKTPTKCTSDALRLLTALPYFPFLICL